MTNVKTSIYLWTNDVTNIRCHVWCYWEQEFGEPMGTYLTHHWLVSETVYIKGRMKPPLTPLGTDSGY
jgi:hypothetical protein